MWKIGPAGCEELVDYDDIFTYVGLICIGYRVFLLLLGNLLPEATVSGIQKFVVCLLRETCAVHVMK